LVYRFLTALRWRTRCADAQRFGLLGFAEVGAELAAVAFIASAASAALIVLNTVETSGYDSGL